MPKKPKRLTEKAKEKMREHYHKNIKPFRTMKPPHLKYKCMMCGMYAKLDRLETQHSASIRAVLGSKWLHFEAQDHVKFAYSQAYIKTIQLQVYKIIKQLGLEQDILSMLRTQPIKSLQVLRQDEPIFQRQTVSIDSALKNRNSLSYSTKPKERYVL